ncbi:hypothetical protein BDN70DRAFT_821602, partial [Pholiota conissans]
RHPFTNIDNYITANVQLLEIKKKYNMHEKLTLTPPRDGKVNEFNFPEYPTSVLCYPREKNPSISDSLYAKIVATLATRYGKNPAIIKRHLSRDNIEFWGKLRRIDGGDLMRAADVGQVVAEDRRDATHVRYQLYVDKYTRFKRIAPEFVLQTFYGQVQQFVLIRLPPTPQLNLSEPATLIYAFIRTCPITSHHPKLDVHYYSNEQGSTDLVDIATVQCLVGRIYDRGTWAIIDRSGKLARAASFDG